MLKQGHVRWVVISPSQRSSLQYLCCHAPLQLNVALNWLHTASLIILATHIPSSLHFTVVVAVITPSSPVIRPLAIRDIVLASIVVSVSHCHCLPTMMLSPVLKRISPKSIELATVSIVPYHTLLMTMVFPCGRTVRV